MSQKKTVVIRKFLNPLSRNNTSHAAISVVAGTMRHGYPNIEFKLADCSSIVELSFWAGDERETRNSLKKVRLIHDTVVKWAERAEEVLEERLEKEDWKDDDDS